MILSAQADGAIARAAQALKDGDLLGLPTETVYGLAADAGNDTAVAKIFAAKGRPADHPLIVHVAQASDAADFASDIPAFAQALMQAFWPGPLTLIMPRRAGVAAAAAGGQNSVGLRCPAHPVAQAVLRAAQALGVKGVAAPSANQFGRVSPTTAAHVAGEFGPELLILDGGACEVGIESTIVDCTRGMPVLLRPGQISREHIQAACGLSVLSKDEQISQADQACADQGALNTPAPRASGTLESHYAPRAKVRLFTAQDVQDKLASTPLTQLALYTRSDVAAKPGMVLHTRRMPHNADACAHELFAVLRELDDRGAQEIWVETPPPDAAWEGVRDRLTRAAA
jgi:L-threonylcarbamoyladenylate synthase